VAVLVGGGSGQYPAFMGVVGPGFADGAVMGNIFASPSTAQAYSVGRIAHSGAGVIVHLRQLRRCRHELRDGR
jgi:dihydroxyacetone kinase